MAPLHRLNYSGYSLDQPESFRLLKLHAGPRNAKSSHGRGIVKADLEVHLVSDAPEYVALSYSWGDQLEFEDIRVRKTRLKVSKHLNNALRQMRDPDAAVYAWIDAICINQADKDERSRQVQMMLHIYATAETVFIWLGISQRRLCTSECFQDSSYQHNVDLDWKTVVDRRTRREILLARLSQTVIMDLLKARDRAWWNRNWVLQETVAAKQEPIVLFDEFAFLGPDLFEFWGLSVT